MTSLATPGTKWLYGKQNGRLVWTEQAHMKLADAITSYGSRIALVNKDGQPNSYSELTAEAEKFARNLGSSKSLVLISARNNRNTVIAYIGCLLHGHVAMLVNDNLDDELYSRILEHYKPDWTFKTDQRGDSDLNHLNVPQREIHPDLAVMLSTSGSTGSPKFVRLSHANINANASSISQCLPIDSNERSITSLPLHYSYGLSILNSHLLKGASVVLTDQGLFSGQFWNIMKEFEVTSFGSVPYVYEMLRKFNWEKMELPSLRYFTQAGGKLSQEMVLYLSSVAEQLSCQCYVMYGQTEATARMTYLKSECAKHHPESIGKPIPGGRLVVVDDSGKEVETGTEGQLIYYGNNVMMGYATGFEDLASPPELEGRLETGDIGYCDENGLYYVTGRLSRFIEVFGNRVSLDDLEGALSKMGWECLCGGNDDQLQIAIVKGPDLVSAKRLVCQKFKLHNSAVSVFNVEEIPISDAGKILRGSVFERPVDRE